MMDIIEGHASLWERMQPLLLKKRIPQAFLFVGPRCAGMLPFINRLMAILLCQQEAAPCGQCRACHLMTQGIHPDITYIRQESPGSVIKIEQIRDLQQNIYQTPQRGSRRFVVIDPAEKMNISAANALLKILEEPPSHTTFMLIAEQIGSIPATILSRCQKYNFPSPERFSSHNQANYLMLGEYYPAESARAELFKQRTTILAALCDMIEGKLSFCTQAAQWSVHAFDDLLWLLYLVTAQAIYNTFIDMDDQSPESKLIARFSQLLKPVNLFHQLERIQGALRKINHNINMNQTLALEDLLLGYLKDK